MALRVNLQGNPRFREPLQRVREETLGAYTHQEVPIDQVAATLVAQPPPNRSLLFQAMFVPQNAPESPLELPGVSMQPVEVSRGSVTYEHTLSLTEVSGEFAGVLEFNTGPFDPATAEGLHAELMRLLDAVLAEPDLPVGPAYGRALTVGTYPTSLKNVGLQAIQGSGRGAVLGGFGLTRQWAWFMFYWFRFLSRLGCTSLNRGARVMMNRQCRFFRSGLVCAATAFSLAFGGCAPGEDETGAYSPEQNGTSMYAERVYSDYQVAAKGRIWLSVSTLQSGALSDIADRSVNETLGVPDYWIQMERRGMELTALRREQRAADLDEWSVPVLLTHFNELGRPVSEGSYRLLSVQVMMDTVHSEHKVLEVCWKQQGECIVMDPVLLQADAFARDRKELLMAGWAPTTFNQPNVTAQWADGGTPDAGGPADAGTPDAGEIFGDDGGSTPTSGGEGSDAGTVCVDAGTDAGVDAGTDAGTDAGVDAGTPSYDAGTFMTMAPPACKKCTLDSNPEWTRRWTNYPAYTRTYRNVYGVTMVSKTMGAQQVGVACAVVGDACKSSGFGSSAASSCWTNVPFTCACDNTGNQTGNSADGSATRSWAETKCTHRLVLDATVKWTKEGKDSEFSIKWETSGAVDANGGQMFDSCSWK